MTEAKSFLSSLPFRESLVRRLVLYASLWYSLPSHLTPFEWLHLAEAPMALPPPLQIVPMTCVFYASSISSLTAGFVSICLASYSTDVICSERSFWTLIFPALSSSMLASLTNFAAGAVSDALVAILTVYRTGRLVLQSRKAGIGKTLSFILLRDGTVSLLHTNGNSLILS